MTNNFKERPNFIRSIADLLRGDYKQSEYGRVILPLTVLRRLDCVLEPTKEKVSRQKPLKQCSRKKLNCLFTIRASLIFSLNNRPSSGLFEFEPSPEAEQMRPEIFGKTLASFADGLKTRSGIDRVIWVKKFIKNIDYSKEEIAVNLCYESQPESAESECPASGRAAAAAGRKLRPIEIKNHTLGGRSFEMAPRAGFKPVTYRLTAPDKSYLKIIH